MIVGRVHVGGKDTLKYLSGQHTPPGGWSLAQCEHWRRERVSLCFPGAARVALPPCRLQQRSSSSWPLAAVKEREQANASGSSVAAMGDSGGARILYSLTKLS